jgi:hypothetical protein
MKPAAFVSVLLWGASSALAQTAPHGAAPVLAGIYQSISDTQALPGGLKNAGGPMKVVLQPSAVEEQKKVDLKEDAAKLCLPVGPFRMMARDRVKIELVPAPNLLVMIYEDVSHGHMRNIHFNRTHPAKLAPSWLGDSIGRWEAGTLVVDTVGFNDRTWLNEAGAPHSDALHLVERIRPLRAGTILEYKVTAEDPKSLKAPYTYVRYYRKTLEERAEDFCEAELE